LLPKPPLTIPSLAKVVYASDGIDSTQQASDGTQGDNGNNDKSSTPTTESGNNNPKEDKVKNPPNTEHHHHKLEPESNNNNNNINNNNNENNQPVEQNNKNPKADAGSDQTVKPGDTVTLDGSGSSDPDGTIKSYSWKIKDKSSAAPSISLSSDDTYSTTFTAPSDVSENTKYTFELKVTDDKDAEDTDTVSVKVRKSENPENIGTGKNDNNSSNGASNTTGTGGSVNIDRSEFNNTATTSSNTTLANQPPVANAFMKETTILPGAVIGLDATKSKDPEGTPLTYSWRQVEGPRVKLTGNGTATPQFTVPSLKSLAAYQSTKSSSSITSPRSLGVAPRSNNNNSTFNRIPIKFELKVTDQNGLTSTKDLLGFVSATATTTATNEFDCGVNSYRNTQITVGGTPAASISLPSSNGWNSVGRSNTVKFRDDVVSCTYTRLGTLVGSTIKSAYPEFGAGVRQLGPEFNGLSQDQKVAKARDTLKAEILGRYYYAFQSVQDYTSSISDGINNYPSYAFQPVSGISQDRTTPLIGYYAFSVINDKLYFAYFEVLNPLIIVYDASPADPLVPIPRTYNVWNELLPVSKEVFTSWKILSSSISPGPTNKPPVAKAIGPSSPVKPGDTVVLDGSGSSDPDNGPQPLTYEWTQTSGSPTVSLHPDTKAVKPTFTAPTVNTATILKFQLIVSDGKDSSVTPSNVDITVLPSTSGGGGSGGGGGGGNPVNQAPVANAGTDKTVKENNVVTLDGSKSTDANLPNDTLTYLWTQTSPIAPHVVFNNQTAIKPIFTAPKVTANTAFEFKLTVKDKNGLTDDDIVKVLVKHKKGSNGSGSGSGAGSGSGNGGNGGATGGGGSSGNTGAHPIGNTGAHPIGNTGAHPIGNTAGNNTPLSSTLGNRLTPSKSSINQAAKSFIESASEKGRDAGETLVWLGVIYHGFDINNPPNVLPRPFLGK
jgi:hypothetical protein